MTLKNKEKLYIRNIMEGLKSWDISLLRFSEPFVNQARKEHKNMKHKTKIDAVAQDIMLKSWCGKLYVIRKDGRRGLASMDNSVDSGTQKIE